MEGKGTTPRALAPKRRARLNQRGAAKTPPFHTLTPQEARSGRRAPQGEPEPVAHVEDRTIPGPGGDIPVRRSEEHTSELQSHLNLVCRLLLEKKKTCITPQHHTGAEPPTATCSQD